ncbi:histidine kinase [Mesorhizobium loti]|nr:CHASE domain-containing protein [Mesorhizobium loti]PLP59839.1 histidine kinase [Mesorhizobium loti]
MKKFFPTIAFVAVALASLVLAGFAYFASRDAARIKFEAAADDAVSRIESRLDLHMSLLRATEAFFSARSGDVSRAEFENFYKTLDVDGNLAGLLGLGYLKLVKPGEEAAAEQEIRHAYGLNRTISTARDFPWRAPIMLLEPLNKEGEPYIGFDVSTDPAMRMAMEQAMADNALHTSGLRMLDPGSNWKDKPDAMVAGFVIFARLRSEDMVQSKDPAAATKGFLYAVFRARDVFDVVLAKTPLLPVNIEAYDQSIAPDNLLFRSEDPPVHGFGLKTVRMIEVAGRSWTVVLRPTAKFTEPSSPFVPVVLGLFGLLLAGTIAMIARYQERAFDAASQLHEATEKSLLEKDLMLQEMRHRIKNSIARVLAISRQTAAHSADLKDFSNSFSARLQSMAASQDMLTRSRRQQADLGDLLRVELSQVFGKDLPDDLLSGPQVTLDETMTQALGLTFHELATNALKYGEAGNSVGALKVCWVVEGKGRERTLALNWTEAGKTKLEAPTKTGFGTRLIDMNITRELRGTIEREFRNNGLRVRIRLPYSS